MAETALVIELVPEALKRRSLVGEGSPSGFLAR
jgi:hypothetical protein